jgi:hypothetical protein
VAMNVGDGPAHVLGRGRADPPQQQAVLRIPDLHGQVSGLPLSFDEGSPGKVGDFCPAVPCFRARVSEGRRWRHVVPCLSESAK